MHFAELTFPELGCIIDLSTRGNEREVKKMLYLMMDARGKNTLIKVGRCKNLNQRLNNYRTHNPLAKLIATLETKEIEDSFLEKICHSMFKSMNYKQVGNTEWYYIPKGEKRKWRKQGFENFDEPSIVYLLNISKDCVHIVCNKDNKTGIPLDNY